MSPEIHCGWDICVLQGEKSKKRRHENIPSKTFIGIRIHWHRWKSPDCLNFPAGCSQNIKWNEEITLIEIEH